MLTKELRYDNIHIVARLVGQGVKTSPSHGENRSSILLQAAELEVWLSLVERCVRDAEVASSNLVTSTIFLSNRIFMRFVCLLPVSSLPCRYRPSACFRRASLRAWARPSAPRCGSGLLLLVGSFLFGFHCFTSLSLILGIKIPPFLRAVKLLSLVLICAELCKKRLFL